MKIYLTLLSLIFSQSVFAQHWNVSELSPMPKRVSNNAVCEGFINGVPYVYSFAGIDSTKIYSGIHNESFRYNTQTDTWETIAPLPDPMGKIATAANRIGNIIYIIGGYYVFSTGGEESSAKVHRYDIANNTYLSDGTDIPISIDDQVQVVYKDSLIYVVSGWHNTSNINEVQVYDALNDTWHEATPLTWMEEPVFGASGTIIEDTIYFFGGAKNGASFPNSFRLRKGAINPDNPLEISWDSEILDFSIKAYRPAATSAGDQVYFLGGSDVTYNFDGIAYSNGVGVDPNNRCTVYRPSDGSFESTTDIPLPMDLRGIANESDTVKYLAGGMLPGQEVTNKLWRLSWQGMITNTHEVFNPGSKLSVSPNPASEILNIELPDNFNSNESSFTIYDINGITILQEVYLQKEIDISFLIKGIYLLKVADKNHESSAVFIKQ